MRARHVYRFSVYLCAFAALVNVFIAVYLVRKMRSPVSYNVKVVEPPSPPVFDFQPVNTQFVSSASVQIPQDPPAVSHWRIPYMYFESGGLPGVYINGRYLYPGSRHAYGIVRDIYPERIYLEGGNYIDNQERTQDHVRDSISVGSGIP